MSLFVNLPSDPLGLVRSVRGLRRAERDKSRAAIARLLKIKR
jgi:hypothetical protein